MPSSRQKEDSKKEHNQKEEKKPEISEHVIAELPPADKINKGGKQKQTDSDPAAVAAATVAASTPPSQPADTEGMIQMGGGLPDLPPKPPVPQRQVQATVSSAFSNGKMAQRVPNVKQVSTPQLNIPAGSDLGAVGKIGAYQMAQIKPNNTSSATQIHANMFFWVYALLFVTIIIMKKQ